jgi:hypothetical protein
MARNKTSKQTYPTLLYRSCLKHFATTMGTGDEGRVFLQNGILPAENGAPYLSNLCCSQCSVAILKIIFTLLY